MIKSMIIAFSMYSSIPMPHINWEKENLKYAVCFFPLVGIVEGLFIYFAFLIGNLFNFNILMQSVFYVLACVACTGGIHLDGYCDFMDAVSSRQSRDKMLAIMKDPHVGAFGVMWLIIYLLLLTGAFSQLTFSLSTIILFTLTAVLCRGLSGLALLSFSCAKTSGLAYTFSDASAKKKARAVLLLEIIAIYIFLFIVAAKTTLLIIPVLTCFFYIFYIFTKIKLGGITGDTCGWFLCIAQLLCILCIYIGGTLL